MNDRQTKDALKEALKEWMDEKYTTFGKWSAGVILAALISFLTWALLQMNGWHRFG